jgi:uncharacterized protein
MMYLQGTGLAKDVARAREFFLTAAVRGNPAAQYEMGKLGRSAGEALRYFFQAAAQNYAPAEFALATMYESGQGTPRDLSQAHIYYNKAAAHGSLEAATALRRLQQTR